MHIPMDHRCWCCPNCLERNQKRYSRKNRVKQLYGQDNIARKPLAVIGTNTRRKDIGGLELADINRNTTDSLCTHQLWSQNPEDMCRACQRRTKKWDRPYNHVPTPGDTAPDLANGPSLNNKNGIVPVDTDDAEVQNLYVDAFLHNNRLEHMIQVMVYHPKYLESFLKTQQFLLRGDGPLPYPYRHYIALMAAGRHQCSYLISIHKTEFLLQGGDERWLKGLKYIPQKLQDLYEINKILAHRPWLINKSHIEKLTRGNDNWSLAELMHALTLLAHFHSLSGLVYGCGITPEIDQEDGHTYRPQSVSLASSPEDAGTSPKSQSGTPNSTSEEGGIEVLMERMKRLNEEAQEEIPQEELLKRFEKVESQSIDLPAASEFPSPNADILRFVEDPTFTYQDFAKRGSTSEIPTFRAQDYSWEEQGYSLANRLYPEIGTLLDDKFRIAYNLTYFTMGHNKSVDTTSFRRSIWNYIHCMFGIRHDDYDYCEVNQLLERHLRSFVKTVTCYPERISRKDYDSFMREFRHSEKVHVNLMLMEARLQGELLYALRAVMRHIT